MKILLLSGANSPHTLNWANSLAEAGHVVYVASQHQAATGYDDRVNIIQLPSNGVLGLIKSVLKLKKITNKIKPDIINAHRAIRYSLIARLVGRRPFIVSVWGSDVYDFPYQSKIHHAFVKSNLMAADRVASTSHCMAKQTRLIAPKLGEISITPFGVDMQSFVDAEPPEMNKKTLVVGTVKTMASKYGIDTLIEAFYLLVNKLLATHSDVVDRLQLRLVGGGPQIEEYQALAVTLGIADKVSFIGPVPHKDVPSELSKLDIYIALSHSESFGVAVIEAGAARRPVVVSNAEGLQEVTLDNKTGLIVPRENPQAAADAIEKLVLNPELRLQMGEAGRQHVLENYTREICTQKMVELYRKVIKNNLD